MAEPVLRVEDLEVAHATAAGPARAVRGVSFAVAPGETLAIVGESGCGKSSAAHAVMGLLDARRASVTGRVQLGARELLGASEAERRSVRGGDLAMVFQDPLTSLNPVQRVGTQIAEQLHAHRAIGRAAAHDRAVELLGRVRIAAPAATVDAHPHELSGGMRQRVMIAMALANEPRVLIADEPTTALDVTIQAQILDLLAGLRAELGLALILITHDLGVVAEIADRVLVMYAGRIVEAGSPADVFLDPQHPYTWGLLGAIPRVDRPVAPRLPAIAGLPPSPLAPPPGCPFQPRCPHAVAACAELPALEVRAGVAGHADRCVLSPAVKRARREVAGRIGLEVSA
ncbi:MAG: ABC transporter ATP-binding protein [Solirubrobacteraceae bacterium]